MCVLQLLLAGHQLLEVHQIKGTVYVGVSFVNYALQGGPKVSNEELFWWAEEGLLAFPLIFLSFDGKISLTVKGNGVTIHFQFSIPTFVLSQGGFISVCSYVGEMLICYLQSSFPFCTREGRKWCFCNLSNTDVIAF